MNNDHSIGTLKRDVPKLDDYANSLNLLDICPSNFEQEFQERNSNNAVGQYISNFDSNSQA
jgi:hypothetical protein